MRLRAGIGYWHLVVTTRERCISTVTGMFTAHKSSLGADAFPATLIFETVAKLLDMSGILQLLSNQIVIIPYLQVKCFGPLLHHGTVLSSCTMPVVLA